MFTFDPISFLSIEELETHTAYLTLLNLSQSLTTGLLNLYQSFRIDTYRLGGSRIEGLKPEVRSAQTFKQLLFFDLEFWTVSPLPFLTIPSKVDPF